MKNPQLVIADEPTGNLDSKTTIEIMNIIKTISREKLVVLVTHEEEIAEFYADRIIRLHDGTVVSDYENKVNGNLEIRHDHIIYLKDLNKQVGSFGNIDFISYSDDIADKLDLPVRLVRDILYELTDTGIVSETVTQNIKEHAYQPGTDTNKLTVSFVLESIERRGQDSISSDNVKDLKKMVVLVDGFSEENEKSKNNKLLIDL